MITNNVTLAMLQAALQNAEAIAVKKSHAVGDVIMRFNNNNPALDFGGTWERTAQGRFPLGASSTGGGYLLGAEGGEAAHTLMVAEMPSHSHLQRYPQNENTGNYLTATSIWGYNRPLGISNDSTTSAGDNQPHNNMPPYVVFNFWKKIAD